MAVLSDATGILNELVKPAIMYEGNKRCSTTKTCQIIFLDHIFFLPQKTLTKFDCGFIHLQHKRQQFCLDLFSVKI